MPTSCGTAITTDGPARLARILRVLTHVEAAASRGLLLSVLLCALALPAHGEGVCGDANADMSVNSSDALAALETGIGAGDCPVCICDVDQIGGVIATDALLILRFGVGHAIVLSCSVCPNPFAGIYMGTYEGVVTPLGDVDGFLDFVVDDQGFFTGDGMSASGQTTFEFDGMLEPDGSFESMGSLGTFTALFSGQFAQGSASGSWEIEGGVGSGTWDATLVEP